MRTGAVNLNARVSVFGVSISVADIQESICRILLRPNGIPCDCASLLAIPERAMQDYVVDTIAHAIEPYLGGASCSSNLVDILAGALQVGVGSSGVSVDFNAANLAKSAICNMVRLGVKQSGELLRYAGTIVSALRNNCVQLIQQSGGQVEVNNRYSTPVITNPQPPVTVAPTPTTPFVYTAPTSTGLQSMVSTKRRISPLLVFSGVAVAVSAVILFKRR